MANIADLAQELLTLALRYQAISTKLPCSRSPLGAFTSKHTRNPTIKKKFASTVHQSSKLLVQSDRSTTICRADTQTQTTEHGFFLQILLIAVITKPMRACEISVNFATAFITDSSSILSIQKTFDQLTEHIMRAVLVIIVLITSLCAAAWGRGIHPFIHPGWLIDINWWVERSTFFLSSSSQRIRIAALITSRKRPIGLANDAKSRDSARKSCACRIIHFAPNR